MTTPEKRVKAIPGMTVREVAYIHPLAADASWWLFSRRRRLNLSEDGCLVLFGRYVEEVALDEMGERVILRMNSTRIKDGEWVAISRGEYNRAASIMGLEVI